MDHTQLKATALAVFGFVPEWSPPLCSAICARIAELGTIPAVYLSAVVEHMTMRGDKLQYRNVILSPRWEEFIPQQLQLMEEQARVKRDLDLLEFRNALPMCKGDYREVLEDVNIDISNLGRHWIAKMYGFEDIAERFATAATAEALANPFLQARYDELQEKEDE